MKLHLPNVTLVAIDTAYHSLVEKSIIATLDKVSFGDVKVFSDRQLAVPGLKTLPCNIRTADDAAAFSWYGIAPYVTTSHVLTVQWDGWVTRPDLWCDDFLRYDWIGAVWPWHADRRVGNGGFSLRSRRLISIMASNSDLFPFRQPEDEVICRHYRPLLERDFGLRWANEETACRFAHEHSRGEAFGFHGLWNFLNVLDEDTCVARIWALSPEQVKSQAMRWLLHAAVRDGRGRILHEAAARFRDVTSPSGSEG